MIRREKPSKWRNRFRVLKITIFLVFCLIVANSNLNAPVIPHSMQKMVQTLSPEGEAFASVNERIEPTVKHSLVRSNKDRAVNWFYGKTRLVPRNLAEDVIQFVTENVEPELQPMVIALVIHESTGNPFEVSRKGAAGATQIMFKYWGKSLIDAGLISEERDLFDYHKNILCCQYVLKQLLKEEDNNMRKALLRYGDSSKYPDNVMRKVDDLNRSLMSVNTVQKKVQSKHIKRK